MPVTFYAFVVAPMFALSLLLCWVMARAARRLWLAPFLLAGLLAGGTGCAQIKGAADSIGGMISGAVKPTPKKTVAQLLDVYGGIVSAIEIESKAGHIPPELMKQIKADDAAAWAALDSAKKSAENGQNVSDATVAAIADLIAALQADKVKIPKVPATNP